VSRCNLETNYFCIKVHEQVKDGRVVRVLVLDRMVHSYSSLDDPTKLVYGYEQVYAEATAYQARDHKPLRALSIGGGDTPSHVTWRPFTPTARSMSSRSIQG